MEHDQSPAMDHSKMQHGSGSSMDMGGHAIML
ncbi:MAG: hypothetical protein JWP78_1730 [Mucilaginibacter sp.]|nr:hypothetical protein [Mucilaginibacter sp.]